MSAYSNKDKCKAAKGLDPKADSLGSGEIIYRFGSKTEGDPQQAARKLLEGEWWIREAVFKQIDQAAGGAFMGSPMGDTWGMERTVRKFLAVLPCWSDLGFVVKARVQAAISIYSGAGIEVKDVDKKTGRTQKAKPYPGIEQVYIPSGAGNDQKLQVVDVRVLAGHA